MSKPNYKKQNKETNSMLVTLDEMFNGTMQKMLSPFYVKPQWMTFRQNKKEMILGINSTSGAPAGDLLQALNSKVR